MKTITRKRGGVYDIVVQTLHLRINLKTIKQIKDI